MPVDQRSGTILRGLHEAQVEYIVVGGMAAILQATAILTEDVDIVHRRTPENVARLLQWLLAHGAYHRSDLANRHLPPKEDGLLGHGHLNLLTNLTELDVLCELGEGEGYEEIEADTVVLEPDGFPVRVLGLERLIAVKGRAGRPKDRAVMHVLIAALDEQRKQAKRR
jgi:hypothetical protein